jgi:tricorn protease-like protein
MRDGKRILFIKKSDLWAIAAEGGEPHKLNLAMKGLAQLRLHPDGRQVAFQAGGSSGEVWAMENFLPAAKSAK